MKHMKIHLNQPFWALKNKYNLTNGHKVCLKLTKIGHITQQNDNQKNKIEGMLTYTHLVFFKH